jgi:drug/metabolite transporter (DMT)-like permease
MSSLVLLAALASAALHAGWNVLAKRQPAPGDGISGIIVATATLCAAALPLVGLPRAETWPWIGAAALCNVAYTRALMAAYDRAAFSLAYPAVRAVIPPTSLLLGWAVLAEPPTPGALLGLTVVVAALALFGLSANRMTLRDASGLAFALAAGVVLASGLVFDTRGIRLGGLGLRDFAAYAIASSLTTASALAALCLIEGRSPLRTLRQHPASCYLGGALLLGSALAALWAYAQGPVALVAAVRESGILFGAVLAVVLLRETVRLGQWFAMALATLGLVLLKLG